jgi:hypothetical protein
MVNRKPGATVYLMTHTSKDGDVKILGVFSSRKKAIEARKSVEVKEGFVKYKKGFFISIYNIDKLIWESGYSTYSYFDGEPRPVVNRPDGL